MTKKLIFGVLDVSCMKWLLNILLFKQRTYACLRKKLQKVVLLDLIIQKISTNSSKPFWLLIQKNDQM